jgi:hypothetical protein
MKATPPMTPPAMAPAWLLLLVAATNGGTTKLGEGVDEMDMGSGASDEDCVVMVGVGAALSVESVPVNDDCGGVGVLEDVLARVSVDDSETSVGVGEEVNEVELIGGGALEIGGRGCRTRPSLGIARRLGAGIAGGTADTMSQAEGASPAFQMEWECQGTINVDRVSQMSSWTLRRASTVLRRSRGYRYRPVNTTMSLDVNDSSPILQVGLCSSVAVPTKRAQSSA